jgi:N-acetylmuramoyl-L-alanine amidase
MKTSAKKQMEALSCYAGTADCDKKTDTKPDKLEAKEEKSGRVTVTGIRHFAGDAYTRVVIDLTSAAEFTYGFLSEDAQKKLPYRAYIDIEDASTAEKLNGNGDINDGLLRGIRLGKNEKGALRVVMDTAGEVRYIVFSLTKPDRIVVDLFPKDEVETKGTVREEKKEYVKTDISVVVIDPGHGGRDPGAVGPTNYYEKTANIKISRYLKQYLEERLGLTVILTREKDTYLSLHERTAIANKHSADLFISVHNNANKSREPYGVSTYFLAVTSDKKALAVAARENDTTIEKLSELDYILTDLMVSAKRNESSLLATFVQDGMVTSLREDYDKIFDIGVCQGPFWVLVGAQMPSILVECSFISNRREEQRLKSDAYLKALASGIADGVEKYIKEIDNARKNW